MSRTAKLYRKNKNFIGYFIAALAGVIVQYLTGTTLLVNFLQWDNVSAFWIGYLVSIPVGFYLTKLLAFNARNSGQTPREIIKYLITIVISGCITVYGADYSIRLLMKFLGDGKMIVPFTGKEFSPAGTLGHFTGMGLSFIFNFIVHKRFTFHQTGLWDKIVGVLRGH
ncbi:MAG: GtrA family protein [Leadbetterella sp.]|nr:GtrA family protein [Leadbetterella sp.]